VIGSENGDKASLVVMVSDRLINEKKLSAAAIIKEISPEINGGGGGQPFLATAGGKNPAGIGKAIEKASELLSKA
jgi:alanyl-tRNA synthetase